MSWVQLNGETWPATDDDGVLRVFIHAPDVNCPRVSWSLDIDHYIEPKELKPDAPKIERMLNIELGDLILDIRDWRRLAGLEIRGDSAWHDAQEFIGPHGYCHNYAHVTVHRTVLKQYAEREGVEAGRTAWRAHDFILRLGNRDGWSFPLELDAWLIPETEYWRKSPETPDEVKRFGEGPPNFRLISRATFATGQVDLTRAAADDPVAHAREILREQIAFEEMHRPEIKWHLRQDAESDKILPMPGWRSNVWFYTPPERLT